ncbi:AzlD domain-containing protein [Bacillaceae bacterium S4-13-56]
MIYAIIIGMAVVTFLPRLLPAFIMEKLRIPEWADKWLISIPYAALGALIFPGILEVSPDKPYIGVIGGLVAVVIAFYVKNVILVVLGAIGVVFLMQVL